MCAGGQGGRWEHAPGGPRGHPEAASPHASPHRGRHGTAAIAAHIERMKRRSTNQRKAGAVVGMALHRVQQEG